MTTTPGIEVMFVARLRGLVTRTDRAALAALRRGVGKGAGDSPEADRQVYALLPGGLHPVQENAFWLVATLFATHPSDASGPNEKPVDLGATLRAVAGKSGAEQGIERRLLAVLGAHRDDMPEHLRRLVSLCKAAEVPLDWAQLLRDLQRWDRDGRPVQRLWARSFWGGRADEPPVESGDEGTASDNHEE